MFNLTFPDGTVIMREEPITGAELLKQYSPKDGSIVSEIHVNHYLHSLNWLLKSDSLVEWADLSSAVGMNVYKNSLGFLLTVAVEKLMNRAIRVNNSASEATFWELESRDGSSVPAEGGRKFPDMRSIC